MDLEKIIDKAATKYAEEYVDKAAWDNHEHSDHSLIWERYNSFSDGVESVLKEPEKYNLISLDELKEMNVKFANSHVKLLLQINDLEKEIEELKQKNSINL